MSNAPIIPGLNDQTGLDMRLPDLDVGEQDVTISTTYHHKSAIGNPDGVNVEVLDHAGSGRGFRINLGGKFPSYGARDCKRLYCAGMGLDLDGERAAATPAAEVQRLVDGSDPIKGKKIRVLCREADKVNAKTGRKYRNVTVLGPATGEAPKLETRTAAPAPAPAAVDWYDFPASDSRHGREQYNASGATRTI